MFVVCVFEVCYLVFRNVQIKSCGYETIINWSQELAPTNPKEEKNITGMLRQRWLELLEVEFQELFFSNLNQMFKD